jgi:hypothetical protein
MQLHISEKEVAPETDNYVVPLPVVHTCLFNDFFSLEEEDSNVFEVRI